MTEVDIRAQIEIERSHISFVARIPLVGHVTRDWIDCYDALAVRGGLTVRAEDQHDRSWIRVFATTRCSRARLLRRIDNAMALIAEADAMDPRPSASAVEAFAYEWWKARRVGQRAPSAPIMSIM